MSIEYLVAIGAVEAADKGHIEPLPGWLVCGNWTRKLNVTEAVSETFRLADLARLSRDELAQKLAVAGAAEWTDPVNDAMNEALGEFRENEYQYRFESRSFPMGDGSE